MSVMVLRNEEFVGIKNYLVKTEIESKKDKVRELAYDAWVEAVNLKYSNLMNYFYKMNIINYCARYKEPIDVSNDNIDFSDKVYTYDLEETIDTLLSLSYNICDCLPTDEIGVLIDSLIIKE